MGNLPTTMTDAEWAALYEEHQVAYFRGELAVSSPQSYTLDEMRGISRAMDESTARVEAALRGELEALAPHARALLLGMLEGADPGSAAFWRSLLHGEQAGPRPRRQEG